MFGNRAPELFVSFLPRPSQAAPSAYDVAAPDHQETIRYHAGANGLLFSILESRSDQTMPAKLRRPSQCAKSPAQGRRQGIWGRPQLHVVSTKSGASRAPVVRNTGARLRAPISNLQVVGPLTFKHKALTR
jgi:hypothetical protein